MRERADEKAHEMRRTANEMAHATRETANERATEVAGCGTPSSPSPPPWLPQSTY